MRLGVPRPIFVAPMTLRRRRCAPLPLLAALAALLLAPARGSAQLLPVGDVWDDYLRVLESVGAASLGSHLLRPLPYARALPGTSDARPHPWQARLAPPTRRPLGGGLELALTDPGARVFASTARPYAPNEGGVWVGKGLTAAVDFGATLAWRRATLTLAPTLAFAQNQAFELAPVSTEGALSYAYPWRRIDLPQRLGPDAVWSADPGQSALRVGLGPVTVGAGTENLWWGPGLRSAVLMSNNAPGFAHALVETSRPLGVGIGTLEAQWIWGRLARSEWFDTTTADPGRYVTGAALILSPKGLAGLHLGLARVFYARVPVGGVGLGETLVVFQGVRKRGIATPDNPSGEDARDQMFSSFLRWVLPGSGFELWGEWARADHGWDYRDYFLEPEHSSIYALGLRKVNPLARNRLLVLETEITNLQRSGTARVRDVPTLYAHHLIPEGYTQRGRLVGAALGPGGNGQYGAVKLYAPWGRAGLSVQRRVVDNDAYYDRSGKGAWCCHNAFLELGADALGIHGPVELSAAATLARELNRYFQDHADHWSLGLRLEARWRPR